MHTPPRPSMPVHPSIEPFVSTALSVPVRDPKEATIDYIRTFRTDTRCSAQGCLNSSQSSGRNLQRCGRCGVVVYCGRECQTKAWKEEVYPHKRLCPILRNIMTKGSGSDLFFEGNEGPKPQRSSKISNMRVSMKRN